VSAFSLFHLVVRARWLTLLSRHSCITQHASPEIVRILEYFALPLRSELSVKKALEVMAKALPGEALHQGPVYPLASFGLC
jgi:hypothetical protein